MSSILEPIWNKPIKEYDRALDPLGMNRVNYRMVEELMLGFTSQTPRARYYAFYVWAINQIRKSKFAKSFHQFEKAFSCSERLFMLSCVAHEDINQDKKKDHTYINGSNTGREVWMKNSEIPLNFSFLGHGLGGYGQYYRGSMVNLGLIEQDECEEYEKPTKLGLEVIKHFGKLAIQSDISSHSGVSTITKQKLAEMGEKICLCNLRRQDAEKEILKEIFFGFAGYDDKYSRSRRESLALILSVIDRAHKQDYAVEEQDFLNSVYFGEIGTLEYPIRITTPSRLTKVAKLWKVVKAHDNLALATESILQSFLGFLAPNSSRGIPLEEFFRHVFNELNDKFENLLDRSGENFVNESVQKIISIVLKEHNTNNDDITQLSKQYDSTIALSSELSEQLFITNLEDLRQTKASNPPETVANGVSLVLLTALRMFWRINSDKTSTKWLANLEKDDVGILKFTNFVGKFIKQNKTIREFTCDFIQEYVILQAENIHRDKMRSSTNPKRWFHQDGSNYVKDRDYYARHREIRFPTAVSLLYDLNLVNESEKLLECTDSGRDMLERVLGT